MGSDFKSLLVGVQRSYAAMASKGLVPLYRYGTRKHVPKKEGIYVLYENGSPLYVGRTRDLWRRLGEHSLQGSDEYLATFAIVLAREETNIPATYKKETSAKHLIANHRAFAAAFDTAKKRIRNMEVRWMEEPDPDSRYLLEFYAAKELRTPCNSFSET